MVNIVGVGNATIDYLTRVTNLPGPNESAFILEEQEYVGGASANVISNLNNFGYDTGLISRVGDDENGRLIKKDLQKQGIDCHRVKIRSGDETAFARIYASQPEKHFTIGGGNSAKRHRITEEDLMYLKEPTLIHTSTYTPPQLLQTLLNTDRNDGLFSVDLSTGFDELSGRGYTKDIIFKAIGLSDLFVGNWPAVKTLFESDDLDVIVDNLRSQGLTYGAITCGEDGSILVGPNEMTRIQAYNTEIVDTTGAGDTFIACLIHTWLFEEYDVDRSGQFAAIGAGLNCQSYGAQTNLPTAEQIVDLME